MAGLIAKIKIWWDASDRIQKIITIFGISFLAMLLFGTFYLTSRPNMKMLFGGLAPADQGMILEELQGIGIKADYDERGNIYVPHDRIAEARAKLALGGKLPSSGHGGYGDLEKLGMMNTPKVEQERIKVALEGELSKSIELLDGVRSARVHLNLGDDSPFISEKKPASASITIVEGGGLGVNTEEARTIARLIANSVPGMEMRNISIVSSRGRLLWDGANEEGDWARTERKIQSQVQESKRREKELQKVLDRTFGIGNTVAMVSLTMDFDRRIKESVEKTPHEMPLTRESNEEVMAGSGRTKKAAAGADANMPEPASPTGAGKTEGTKQSYKGKQTSEKFGSNEVRTKVEGTPGRITSMSVNVMVDSKSIKDTAQVEKFLRGYLGPFEDNPQFSSTVTSVPFDRKAEKAAAEAAAKEASREQMQQIISLLPIAALILVGLIVAKSISKFGASRDGGKEEGKTDGSASIGSGATALPQGPDAYQQVMADGAQQGNYQMAQLPPGQLPMPQQPGLPPQPGQQPMLASGVPANTMVATENGELPETGAGSADSNGDLTDIGNIPDKINVPLEQIKNMANEKPEAVAMLVKTWLAEE